MLWYVHVFISANIDINLFAAVPGNWLICLQSQSNVAASTARNGYENCTTLCRNTTVSAYSAQTTSTRKFALSFANIGREIKLMVVECLGVMYDNARTITANINCYLQGNNLSSTTTTASSGIVNFINGRCEQQNVGTGTYCKSPFLPDHYAKIVS